MQQAVLVVVNGFLTAAVVDAAAMKPKNSEECVVERMVVKK
jgi:hypothetical protein